MTPAPSELIKTGLCPVGHGQLVRGIRCEQCQLTFVYRSGGSFISGMPSDYIQVTLDTPGSNYASGYSGDFTCDRFDNFPVLEIELWDIRSGLQQCTRE